MLLRTLHLVLIIIRQWRETIQLRRVQLFLHAQVGDTVRCWRPWKAYQYSDLLVRHERLTHRKAEAKAQIAEQDAMLEAQARDASNNADDNHNPRPAKRIRSSYDTPRPVPLIRSMMSPPALDMQFSQTQPAPSMTPMSFSHNGEFSLTALSMAAEYQALHGNMADTSQGSVSLPTPMPSQVEITTSADTFQAPLPEDIQTHFQGPSFSESFDNLTSFLETEPLSTYNFASLVNTEQPMPFFSPDSFGYGPDVTFDSRPGETAKSDWRQRQQEEPQSLSRFGSRFPSMQPEDRSQEGELKRRSLADISHEDRRSIIDMLDEFSAVIPAEFKLPTRLALCRYIAAYVNGFHEHMPFLHIPTMSVVNCSIELVLAMAAIGAQYTFEGERGVELFNISRTIASHRIRKRDARLVASQYRSGSERSPSIDLVAQTPARSGSTSGPLGLPTEDDSGVAGEDLMQTAQALLLLMALCTWAKHKEILREALAIQSVLATLIRDDGMMNEALENDASWSTWIRRESVKRTKFIVYGFSNLHCIVYSIPPFMLTSEVKLALPCSAAEFKAPTEALWREARSRCGPEVMFQDALKRLFSKDGRDVTERNSSSGNYALIHALIQQVFFLRQTARCRFDGTGDLSLEDVTSLELALRNWQLGWRRNRESSLDPMSPDGPVAFNSTALLRLAYIRLYVDTAGRALETRDPILIANAFRAGPAVKRSPKIIRAVLHSAHALSIPIKIGYRLVAKTQSFIWSIQHSLCTLECAYLMSKWLEALSTSDLEPAITEDEQRILSIVKSMLDETDFAIPTEVSSESPEFAKHLSAGVLRVWATIFKGTQTWAIVDVIGTSLNLYADMLENE